MHPDLFRHWIRRLTTAGALSIALVALAACAVVTPVVDSDAAPTVEPEMAAGEEAEPEPEGPPPFEAPTTVVASDLRQPRQLVYASDGTLYIAEAGIGGSSPVVVSPESTINSGLTSQISTIGADGTHTVVLPGLPSTETRPGNAGYRGAQAILVTDDMYWFVVGEGPAGFAPMPLYRTVMAVDRETLRIQHVIDTMAAAIENNQPDPDAINSDPTDLALADDGTLYIADAGCNCLWSWTEADGLQAAVLWDVDDNPVPTSVDIGPDGDVYVGFLSGFPFEVGSARIERWSGGELAQTYGDLTMVTDVLVADDGTIYAVEFAAGMGDAGFVADSGRVITVGDDVHHAPAGGAAHALRPGHGCRRQPRGQRRCLRRHRRRGHGDCSGVGSCFLGKGRGTVYRAPTLSQTNMPKQLCKICSSRKKVLHPENHNATHQPTHHPHPVNFTRRLHAAHPTARACCRRPRLLQRRRRPHPGCG